MLRNWTHVWILVCGLVLSVLNPLSADERAKDLAFFEKRIRPALVKHCYACHSADAVKQGKLGGGLQLDTREGIRRGGDTGPAVTPGNPSQSLLLAAIRHEQDLEMPPEGEPLTESMIRDFETWITDGALDPRDGKPLAAGIDLEKARAFWSFRKVRGPSAPAVRDDTWPRTDLDRFVAARREAKGIPPTHDAARVVLLRRLYFDLLGLPPTPEEVAAHSDSPWEEVVDDLLASPHFGERWGRHWLDVARFAESNGRARNMAWHHAWRYRNWVIDSINSDMPYDQFIAQQIAGDLLPAKGPSEKQQMRIATGFLALGPKSLEERKRELFRMDLIDEQIDVISRGILGLSVSCARCHDHKFDPVPTADYYALAGILRSTDTLYGIGPMGIKGVNDSSLLAIGPNAERLREAAASHLKSVQEQTQKRNTARSDRYRVVRRVADRKRQLNKNASDASTLTKEISAMEEEIKEWDEKIKLMDAELARLVASPPPQPDFAMAVRDAVQPADCRIRIRGEPENYGERVARGVLKVIDVGESASVSDHESGRLQLARWLSSRDNPLTARVMVNRIWLHLFGRGLIDTPDDFGASGSPPSHPLLLDYLASRFMENWSIKQLIREIVVSRTYQLSSQSSGDGFKLDPDNILLWRMPVRRLEVEPFRDALLSVGGRLRLERPVGSTIQTIGVFSDYEFNSRVKMTDEMLQSDHRSVYLPVVRGALPEMFQLFDFADPNALIGRRDQTTVPSQALFLVNSPRMVEHATATAERLLRETQLNEQGRIQLLYRLALSRDPTADEQRAASQYLRGDQGLAKRDANPAGTAPNSTAGAAQGNAQGNAEAAFEAWISLCHAVLASNEFRHIK